MKRNKADEALNAAIRAAKLCISDGTACPEKCPYLDKGWCRNGFRDALLELAGRQGLHTGHWIDDADCYICSECGYDTGNPNLNPNGAGECPQCHARMVTSSSLDEENNINQHQGGTHLEYELINMSDAYTFLAKDKETAALVVGCLGPAYGAETAEREEEYRIPIFVFGGYEKWYMASFGRSSDAGLQAKKKDVSEALLSFMRGGFDDRPIYQAALDAIDDPEKKEVFMEQWQESLRTSINNIGKEAHTLGKALAKEVLEQSARMDG